MSDTKEEYSDNLLGGFAIILVGLLLSSSAVWGVVDDVYSMNGGLAPALAFAFGIGSIILGALIFVQTLRRNPLSFDNEKTADTFTGDKDDESCN